jgi:hypothetical protein
MGVVRGQFCGMNPAELSYGALGAMGGVGVVAAT